MFNLGMGEILVLGVIALIVIGPEKLPGFARNVGRFISELKRTTSDVTREISRSIDEQSFNKSLKDQNAQLDNENLNTEVYESEDHLHPDHNLDTSADHSHTDDDGQLDLIKDQNLKQD